MNEIFLKHGVIPWPGGQQCIALPIDLPQSAKAALKGTWSKWHMALDTDQWTGAWGGCLGFWTEGNHHGHVWHLSINHHLLYMIGSLNCSQR